MAVTCVDIQDQRIPLGFGSMELISTNSMKAQLDVEIEFTMLGSGSSRPLSTRTTIGTLML